MAKRERNEYFKEYAIRNRDEWNYIQHKSRAKTFIKSRGELPDLLELQTDLNTRIASITNGDKN